MEQQGLFSDYTVSPLDKPNGATATKGKDKVESLAPYFSGKMSVPDPDRLLTEIPWQTNQCLSDIQMTPAKV